MNHTSVVILAGGLATRMKPITEKIPKSLIEVNGRPFIDHQIRLLERQNIKHLVLSIGYKGQMLEDHLRSLQTSISIDFSYDGDKLLGTGGAIKKALPLISDDFLVLYGDSYINIDFAPIIAGFTEKKQSINALMTVFKNDGMYDNSNVIFRDNTILNYSKNEKLPQMDYIDWGLSLFSKSAFSLFPSHDAFDLAAVFQESLRHRKLMGYEVFDRFYEIGSHTGLQELSDYLRNNAAHTK